jgi:hypothetical protein
VIEALLAAGVRIDVVQGIAGHASAQMTFDIYAHATAAARQQASQVYGAMSNAAGGPSEGLYSRVHSESILPSGDELPPHRLAKAPA